MSAILAYKNFCFEPRADAAELTGTFAAANPLSNLLTSRLGELAIASTAGAVNTFEVTLIEGSPTTGVPVRVVAILNHNIISFPPNFPNPFNVSVTDVAGRSYGPDMTAADILNIGHDGSFQNHLILILPEAPYPNIPDPGNLPVNMSEIYKVNVGIGADVVCGIRDPYTGEETIQPFSAGGIWAGPIFQPENGIAVNIFSQGVIDPSRVARSVGGQVWSSPEERVRKGSIGFAGLFEREVYALAPTQSLQQLAAHCGTSRPILVIPVSSDTELMYFQAIYGYADSVPKWSTTDKVIDAGALVRLYTGTLDLTEAK